MRRSRARAVAAADADRRRIERELHDGPQQRLVALAVELQRARLLAGDSPAELSELLEGLAEDVRAALEELRELAARIHPPLLVGHGLAASLRAAVVRSISRASTRWKMPSPNREAAFTCASCWGATNVASISRLRTTEQASTRARSPPTPFSRVSPTAFGPSEAACRWSRLPGAERA